MVVPSNDIGSTATWTVAYDNDGPDADSIDAQEFASAILAIRQLCLRSNRIINGDATTASLRVFAPERGSFDVLLELSVVVAAGLHALPGSFVAAADTLKSILIGDGNIPGVVGIYKLLKGRQYAINEINGDTVNIIDGDVNLNISMGEHSVLQDVGIRGNLRTIVEPLRERSFDRIIFRDADGELIELEYDDFDWPSIDEPPDEQSSFIDIPSQRLRVTAPNLENRNAKWQLNDGQATRWYSISDENFLQRVINGEERFGKGDILICDVRITQTITNGNEIKSDYRIVQVVDRGIYEVQLPLGGI